MSKEEWRPIETHPGYSVSSEGRVRRDRDGYMMSCSLTRDGYLKTNLGKAHPKRTQRVHRLVCAAFHGPAPSHKHVAHHKNGDRADARAENVEWLTQHENVMGHNRFKHGTKRITNEDIHDLLVEILSILKEGRNAETGDEHTE